MLVNILPTRCMDLVSIVLQMAIGTRVLGMRVDDKGLECIRLEMGKCNLVIGKMEFSMSQAHKTLHILYLL